jgi:hypothetical protein
MKIKVVETCFIVNHMNWAHSSHSYLQGKCYGWRTSWKSSAWRKISTICFVIVRVLSILPRIQVSTLEPRILIWGIIGFWMLWVPSWCNLRRSLSNRMVWIWWRRYCPVKSYLYVARKWTSQCPPHDSNVGDLLDILLMWVVRPYEAF